MVAFALQEVQEEGEEVGRTLVEDHFGAAWIVQMEEAEEDEVGEGRVLETDVP